MAGAGLGKLALTPSRRARGAGVVIRNGDLLSLMFPGARHHWLLRGDSEVKSSYTAGQSTCRAMSVGTHPPRLDLASPATGLTC